ncbi:hypothetical protein Ocepr_1793 [Oceanithermus profundus DSM 14977]|uniref:Reverse transcriptase domain-containing protein n=1 Tax=Oceanithermus profundus (strain DSM 14977 / NBRC 100410 / VKM B-2274 / 506) TaxID=670487 RepID=E4U9T1_OCEP5|nr:RNA-directed DNA polymerase [Oceanithermus profundus]ADR37245.1 hypothetical protein Ocepr_1793 [Oceanithermus profundus DSM 14977]
MQLDSLPGLIPKKWSLLKFIRYGALPAGLPPSFSMHSLSQKISTITNLAIGTNDKFAPVVFTFPRPGIEGRRRIGHVLNPVSIIRIGTELKNRWPLFRSVLVEDIECCIESSLPLEDPEKIRYINPAMTHTNISTLLDSIHIAYKYMVKVDIQSYYSSIYTHSFEWALAGKDNAKNKCNNCSSDEKERYEAGRSLDTVIRSAQSAETYGIPIGPDSSFVAAELIGKAIIKSLIAELKQRKHGDFFIIRHVDDIHIYTNSNPQEILAAARKAFRIWNLTPNEAKFNVTTTSSIRHDTWTERISSFMPDGQEKMYEFSEQDRKYAKRDKFKYIEIDYWNLKNYLAIIRQLQDENPHKSVITYGLRRLHFNNRIYPSKGYGKPYLMNDQKEYYLYLDMQLSSLLTAYPQYIDVITDVYLWYEKWQRYSPKYLKVALENIIDNATVLSDHHFELAWSLWLAMHFKILISDEIMDKLFATVRDTVTILQLLSYSYWWSKQIGSEKVKSYIVNLKYRIDNSETSIARFSTMEDAFKSEDWLFYYSLHFAPWPDVDQLKIPIKNSGEGIGELIQEMWDRKIEIFKWKRHIRAADRLLGVSRKGRGGVSARLYPT